MKARVKWIENNTFLGESNSGHAVVMAASTSPGGGAATLTILRAYAL